MSAENGSEPVVDATVVEDAQAVEVRAAVAPAPVLAVVPQASPQELVARLDAIKETQKLAMEKGIDYGEIPGTNKPTLLKPGAEKLAALFQLDVEPSNEKRWEEGNHLTVVSRVTIFYAPTGARLGSGEGVCTTRERKYAYRQQNRKCPKCCEEAVIKGKKEYGGGWLCFTKKGGCNSKWPDGDQAIEGQEVGEIDNPDLPDLWNTVDKMATKRALVAAVLIVTGASAVFTQDVEDLGQEERAGSEAFHRASAEAGQAQRPKADEEVLSRIAKAIGALGLSYKDLALILGAHGASWLGAEDAAGLRATLEGLSALQADAIEAHLDGVAEKREGAANGS